MTVATRRYYTLRVSGVRADGLIFARRYANHEEQAAKQTANYFRLNNCVTVIVEGTHDFQGKRGQNKHEWEFVREVTRDG